MNTYLVHMPAEDVRRLDMFSSKVLLIEPMPQLASLSPRHVAVVVQMSEALAEKLVTMFPNWQIELLQQ